LQFSPVPDVAHRQCDHVGNLSKLKVALKIMKNVKSSFYYRKSETIFLQGKSTFCNPIYKMVTLPVSHSRNCSKFQVSLKNMTTASQVSVSEPTAITPHTYDKSYSRPSVIFSRLE